MKIHSVVLNLLHVGMDRQTDFAKLIFTSLQILVANMPEKALSTYGQMICHCDHKSSSVLGVEYTVLIKFITYQFTNFEYYLALVLLSCFLCLSLVLKELVLGRNKQVPQFTSIPVFLRSSLPDPENHIQ